MTKIISYPLLILVIVLSRCTIDPNGDNNLVSECNSEDKLINEILPILMNDTTLGCSFHHYYTYESERVKYEIPIFNEYQEYLLNDSILRTKLKGECTFNLGSLKKKKIDVSCIDYAHFINIDSLSKYRDVKHRMRPIKYYRFSPPQISKDSLCLYFELSYSCGDLCGNTKAFVFKKTNTKWLPIYSSVIKVD